jgi:hypothetical protein
MNDSPKRPSPDKEPGRRREGLVLLALVLPGFLLMCAAGQFALRILPAWNAAADMGSLLNPNGTIAAYRQGDMIEPVSQEILTPFSFAYLTPGYRTPIPPAPAAATEVQPPTSRPVRTATPLPTPTRTLVFLFPTDTRTRTPVRTATRTSTPTRTLSPTNTGTSTQTFTATHTSTFTGTFTPTSTATDTPTSTFTETSTPTVTDTPTETFTPSDTPTPSETPTETPTITSPNCLPNNRSVINVGPSPIGLPDGNCTTIDSNSNPGDYGFSSTTPITKHGTSGWDMVYYERAADPGIAMDFVIVQISTDGNDPWYTVLDWGGDVYTNTSLNGFPETDNSPIPWNVLVNMTGVGIDIDAASLGIPPGDYYYVRIISPTGDSDNGCDVDAIQVIP